MSGVCEWGLTRKRLPRKPLWGGGDTSGVVETLLGWWKPSRGGGNPSSVVGTLLGWWKHFWVVETILGCWEPFWDGGNSSGVVKILLGWWKHVFFLLFLSLFSFPPLCSSPLITSSFWGWSQTHRSQVPGIYRHEHLHLGIDRNLHDTDICAF